jgi:isocitrate dehydrogenase
MTKDLAILIGADAPWMNTQNFLAKIDDNLRRAMT